MSSSIFRSACLAADVVIDIGSHIGYYSLLAASSNPNARIVAIEGSPDNAAVLSSNVSLNQSNIEVWNAIFCDSSGLASLKITEASDNCGISGHPNSPTIGEIEIRAITGNELEITPLQRLVIKIDVEGHEMSALKGLHQVLDEALDVRILIEFNPKCILAAGESPRKLLEWIWRSNFRTFTLDEKRHLWQEVTDFGFAEKIKGGFTNLWCVPADKAMTVCVVMHASGLEGAGRSQVEVVESLVGAGCMVHTISPAPDLGLVEPLREVGSSTSLVTPYPWWTLPINHSDQVDSHSNWQDKLVNLDIFEVINSVDPEIVVTQTIVAPQGAITALALGKPHVWWIREFSDTDHGLKLPLSNEHMGDLFLSLSQKVLTNSAAVRDYFFPTNRELVSVVYPIPQLRIHSSSNLRPDRPWTIGIVGSLKVGKGQAEGVQAIAQLFNQGLDINLVCIGGGSEEYLNQLEKLAADLGIQDKVSFLGQLQDRLEIYDLVDAIAVTSKSEAFGRVPFEATDAGVPVVYSKSGGIVEYMVEGQTGLAYTAGNIQELAQAIKSLATNPELGLRLFGGARAHIQFLRNNPTYVDALVVELRESRDSYSENFSKNLFNWIIKSAVMEFATLRGERDAVVNSTIWKLFGRYNKLRLLRRIHRTGARDFS
jgi:FkbM family methyltransferase